MMVGRESLGAGMRLLEPLRLAVSESLLPSGTSQPGPPVCMQLGDRDNCKYTMLNDNTLH